MILCEGLKNVEGCEGMYGPLFLMHTHTTHPIPHPSQGRSGEWFRTGDVFRDGQNEAGVLLEVPREARREALLRRQRRLAASRLDA